MAKILGINPINYIDKKKVESKLSFNYGEKFSAKLCDLNKSTGEATLKLPNGWEFKAEIKDSLESMEGKSLKFQVKDFSEGKLKLELVQNESEIEIKDSLEKVLSSVGLEKSEENIELLEKMLKHNITLTKENIMEMKNLLNLKEKISDTEEEENFIKLFMEKEGVSIDSEKGKFIYNTLKEFFQALKNSDLDSIIYLKENNIEVTKENIESLNNLIKDTGLIGKDIELLIEKVLSDLGNNADENVSSENLKGGILDFFVKDGDIQKVKNSSINNGDIEANKTINSKEITLGQEKGNVISENGIENKEINNVVESDLGENQNFGTKNSLEKNLINSLNSKVDDKSYTNEDKKVISNVDTLTKEMNSKEVSANDKVSNSIEETSKNSLELDNKTSEEINKENVVQEKNINSKTDKDVVNTNIKTSDLSNLSKNIKLIEDKNLNMNMEKNLNIILKENGIDLSKNINKDLSAEVKNLLLLGDKVKEDIMNNLSTIKHNIKTLIKLIDENPKLEEQLILNNLKGPINNLKVYNSLSNEYYYLDCPLKVKENEYPFKLIVKNKNKKNKKIDSKSAKIIASIKTINMGTIDNYITINNNNLEVRINAPQKYVKMLYKYRTNLEEGLNHIGYNSHVIVQEKIEEINLKNSCEFFNDKNFTTINALI